MRLEIFKWNERKQNVCIPKYSFILADCINTFSLSKKNSQ